VLFPYLFTFTTEFGYLN